MVGAEPEPAGMNQPRAGMDRRRFGSANSPPTRVRPRCDTRGMRFFNTAGPISAEDHYHVPPLSRLDLDDLRLLIRQKKYFVLHAPRQTGKTSTLLALRDALNGGGRYRCVYVNVEGAQAAREDVEQAMRALLSELASWARATLRDEFLGAIWPDVLAQAGPHGALREGPGPVGRGGREAAGAAGRRDRRAGGRRAAVGAAPTAGRLRPASGGLSAMRDPVRRARRARLPGPVEP